MSSVAGNDQPSAAAGKTVYKTPQEVEQEARLKRLARIDRHTLLEGEMAELESLSNDELAKLMKTQEATQGIKATAGEILRKRLDPEDQGTVEV